MPRDSGGRQARRRQRREAQVPGVIRHRVPVQATPLSFVDLEQQAAGIIETARRRAADETREAMKSAGAEIARQRDEAYRAGLEEGRAAGLAEVRAQAEQRIATELEAERSNLRLIQDALRTALVEFEAQRHRLHADAESGVVRLALAIARRVCELHVERNEDAAAPIARRLIDMARHAADIELRVNPAEYRALAEVGKQAAAPGVDQRHIHVIADETIARGGCFLRSADSSVDASIETQLARIAEVLVGGESSLRKAEARADRTTSALQVEPTTDAGGPPLADNDPEAGE
ncbi:MAG: hypothetical protein AMXMBFR47_24160 [Planctomycetota bacterium]